MLSGFAVYFTLHLDDDEANDYCSGPEGGPPAAAWDQNCLFLPSPLSVSEGQRLRIHARHEARAGSDPELSCRLQQR